MLKKLSKTEPVWIVVDGLSLVRKIKLIYNYLTAKYRSWRYAYDSRRNHSGG